MHQKFIPDLQRRFLGIGFTGLQQELGCSYHCEVSGNFIVLQYYTLLGKLCFKLDVEADIDPLTYNLTSYTGSWQRNISIEPITVDGISTVLLENQFLEFNYLSDVEADAGRKKLEDIKMELKILAGSKKAEAVKVYQLFIAKYGQQFHLTDAAQVTLIRQQLHKKHFVQRKFSLVAGKLTTPDKAYQQLVTALNKSLKKN